jgi:hypothetical protein
MSTPSYNECDDIHIKFRVEATFFFGDLVCYMKLEFFRGLGTVVTVACITNYVIREQHRALSEPLPFFCHTSGNFLYACSHYHTT